MSLRAPADQDIVIIGATKPFCQSGSRPSPEQSFIAIYNYSHYLIPLVIY